MHTHDLSKWQHAHVFGAGNVEAERGTQAVMWITLAMMAVEIGAGWWFNSMALLADGRHMSSHALALGLSALAYGAALRQRPSLCLRDLEDRSPGRLHQYCCWCASR
jgi:Co/Zn/Cd efflux system component